MQRQYFQVGRWSVLDLYTILGLHFNLGWGAGHCKCIIFSTSRGPQSKALVIQQDGRRPRGRPRNSWGDDVPIW